jgi:hypothetical protein
MHSPILSLPLLTASEGLAGKLLCLGWGGFEPVDPMEIVQAEFGPWPVRRPDPT